MNHPLRVLYLQLPVTDFGDDYWGADHALAGGFLSSYARARGVDHEPCFLPPELTSRASTAALVDAIAALSPDVLAVTLYLWNVDRSVALVRTLKRRIPQLRVLAGGPETPDLWRRLPDSPFDWVCTAEGEARFTNVLRTLSRDRAASATRLRRAGYRKASPIDLAELPSPYIDGSLPPAPDGSLWVETMRGCPNRCAFCYYGKAHRGLRHYPPDWLGRHLRYAERINASEMYVLDPSFQATPHLHERLNEVARLNQGNVPLHTEVRVEDVTPALADAMVRAGFRSVETGLQSARAEALRQIRRPGNPKRFAHGARLLKDRGVAVVADAILGLPGDDPEGFLYTIDFLISEGLSNETVVFPLLFLPGTDLRRRARELRCRYQDRAPHQVLRTPTFDVHTMRALLAEAEQRLGQSLYPFHLPNLSALHGDAGRVHVLRITDALPPTDRPLETELTNNPVFLFSAPHGTDWKLAEHWTRWQKSKLPFANPFWGFETNVPPDPEDIGRFFTAAHDPDSYTARRWSLAPEPYLRLSCRPFVLSDCPGPADPWLLLHEHLPVLRRHRSNHMPNMTGPLQELPVLWDTAHKISEEHLRQALPIFEGREQELLFSHPLNARRWADIAELGDSPPYPLSATMAR